jgi:hypothetical protein
MCAVVHKKFSEQSRWLNVAVPNVWEVLEENEKIDIFLPEAS